MKKFGAFLLTGLLSVSMLSANEMATKQGVGGLQSQEIEFLFGTNARASDFNVAVLSEEELKETQGEVAPALVYIGSAIAGGVLGAVGGDIYKGIKRIFGW